MRRFTIIAKKPDHKGLFSCPSALHYSFLPATEFTNFPSIVEISTTSVNSCVATCYSLPNCTATLYHISESDGVTYRRCRLFNADLNCNDDNPQVSDFPDGSVIEYLLVYCIECKKEAKNGTTVAVTTEQQISERIGHTKASATKSPLVWMFLTYVKILIVKLERFDL